MKKKALLFLLVSIIVSTSLVYAGGDNLGLDANSPNIIITPVDNPSIFSIIFSISGLQPRYEPGATIILDVKERLLVTAAFCSKARLVVEFYNMDTNTQTINSFIEAKNYDIGALIAGNWKYFQVTWKHPNTLNWKNSFGKTVDTGKRGVYSVSSYILCTDFKKSDGSLVPAKEYSTVTELNFLIESLSETTVKTTSTGTSTVLGTTTTTVEGTLVNGKLELISSRLGKTELKVGDTQTVTAEFRALQTGSYVVEAFYQSTNEVFSVIPINVLVNECDAIAGVQSSLTPQFRNKIISLNTGDTALVTFEFPAISIAGNHIMWVDAVEKCRSSTYLIPNTRVSGFKVIPIEGVLTTSGNSCTIPNGGECTPTGNSLVGLGDDSGPSIQCKSGWCTDVRLGKGECNDAGVTIDGSISFGSQPADKCVELGTVRPAFSRGASNFLRILGLEDANIILIVVMAIIAIIVLKVIFGRK